VTIHILRERATPEQVAEMLEALDTYIKLAVDIEQRVVAGGGAMHRDGEAMLLENGSRQENIWGADWDPQAKQVRFEALINIRPRQNNRSMHIQDTEIKKRVEAIVRQFFEHVK
jgi:hypothetical protein